jgi:hypothetical protein
MALSPVLSLVHRPSPGSPYRFNSVDVIVVVVGHLPTRLFLKFCRSLCVASQQTNSPPHSFRPSFPLPPPPPTPQRPPRAHQRVDYVRRDSRLPKGRHIIFAVLFFLLFAIVIRRRCENQCWREAYSSGPFVTSTPPPPPLTALFVTLNTSKVGTLSLLFTFLCHIEREAALVLRW